MSEGSMDASKAIAVRYSDIITRCDGRGRPEGLSHADRVIYYLVSVRCEADMNGFCSVFEQLLDWDELAFFVEALRELGRPDLAATYEEIGSLLLSAGYYPERTVEFHELPEAVLAAFDGLEAEARQGDPLWTLDERLCTLR
jgi:hypothetical protein